MLMPPRKIYLWGSIEKGFVVLIIILIAWSALRKTYCGRSIPSRFASEYSLSVLRNFSPLNSDITDREPGASFTPMETNHRFEN